MIYDNEDINYSQPEAEYEGYVAVSFLTSPRFYYFGTNNHNMKLNDKVVVETARGMELGIIAGEFKPIEEYTGELGLKPILRIANETDIKMHESNQKDAVFAVEICKTEIERLHLDMRLISCEYTLDKAKIIFSYLSDDRVDFRELLKILAPKFHTRIELRQVNSREKAKMVGGVGMCGLKLCCATFLNEFDGISINRAKNQMLAINVPKLSGHCGKLLCCLKYEDDTYTELKKSFPNIGERINIDNREWKITGLNIITGQLKLECEGDIQNISLDDYKKYTGAYQRPVPEEPRENNVNHTKEESEQNKRGFFKRKNRFKNKKHHNEEK